LVVRQVALPIPITQFTLGGHDLFWPTLSTVDGAQVKRRSEKCQCRFSVQYEFIRGELCVLQSIEAMKVVTRQKHLGLIFHRTFHNGSRMEMNLTNILTPETFLTHGVGSAV
jgi:hypothetical protein